jgi:hypothetical protein
MIKIQRPSHLEEVELADVNKSANVIFDVLQLHFEVRIVLSVLLG